MLAVGSRDRCWIYLDAIDGRLIEDDPTPSTVLLARLVQS